MNWFRQNPKLSAAAITAGIAAAAAIYLIYTFHASYVAASEAYAENTSILARLQSGKPFPNKENLDKLEAELKDVETTLASLSSVMAKDSGVVEADIDPQEFQDRLNKAVGEITAAAEKAGSKLPEDFYLGFDKYQTELPSVEAAPLLGQQLLAVASAVNQLLAAKVESVTQVSRRPLPVETADQKHGDKKQSETSTVMSLAPFDIAFTGDQSRCRDAFARIVASKPILFVRLVEIANSTPDPPAKSQSAATPPPAAPDMGVAGQVQGEARIPVIFGEEKISMILRLASLSGNGAAAPTAK
ncbi:MAG: hypothetical protein FGM15_07385 [Chthoniobacterales bacterium]|nr:hypothetical protein [Chthoniobacterales bacterium]